MQQQQQQREQPSLFSAHFARFLDDFTLDDDDECASRTTVTFYYSLGPRKGRLS
jgi:hypothetical protein